MKKLLIISLVAVVVGVSALTACGCGQQLTENDIATIQGLISRVDSLESQVANLQSNVSTLDSSGIPEGVDLSQMQTDLNTISANLNGILSTDGTVTLDSLATLIVGLETRLAALETGEQEEQESDGEEPPSGEVTVILDVDADPYQFMSGVTPANYLFPVKITNGTEKYKQVTYNITLHCVSTDQVADVAGGYSLTVNTVAMVATPVPGDTDCQWIYFLWTDPGAVPVAPGKTVTIYTMLNDFETSSGFEVWEVTLAGVNVSDM